MTIAVVGTTAVAPNLSAPLVESIAIPPEAREGDLLVLVLLGPKEGAAYCGDPRMQAFAGGLTIDDGKHGAYVGNVDESDLSDISIDFSVEDTGGAAGHIVPIGMLVAIRRFGATSLKVEPGKRQVTAMWDYRTGGSKEWPGYGGARFGALCVYVSGQVGIGGAESDYALVDPPWHLGIANGSYFDIAFLISEEQDVQPVVAPTVRVNAWRADVMPFVSGTTPTRQYPRDDGTGHSSAPRSYPPSKAQRIVGGYQ